MVPDGEAPPEAPEGGTVKLAPLARVFPNEAFGYRTITVERPLKDAEGRPLLGQKGKAKGKPQPDPAVARHGERPAIRGRGQLLRA